MMGTLASIFWRRTRSTRFAASTGEPRPDRTVLSCADMERRVPELQAAPVMRCAILDVVSWFPGVLQQLWIDVSVRCPHAERYNESASKPRVAAVAGEMEKTKRYGTAVRSLIFETYGRLGGEGTQVAA